MLLDVVFAAMCYFDVDSAVSASCKTTSSVTLPNSIERFCPAADEVVLPLVFLFIRSYGRAFRLPLPASAISKWTRVCSGRGAERAGGLKWDNQESFCPAGGTSGKVQNIGTVPPRTGRLASMAFSQNCSTVGC